MELVTLTNFDAENVPLKAVFAPEIGMNLTSYSRGGLEVIDQSTKGEFERRFAGLGPLIGPHFHTHTKYDLPDHIDESRFPHIKVMREDGKKDVFSHGIGRYAPWKFVHSGTQIKGELHGNDIWNGYPLSELEGHDFEMHFEARLLSSGLFIRYSVTSEKPSMIGLHYYYRLDNKTGFVQSHVENKYNDQGAIRKGLDPTWHKGSLLKYNLNRETDFGFYPLLNNDEYRVLLQTKTHAVNTSFLTTNESEALFQVYHPDGASFCCVEPMSAHEPRKPTLSHSTLECKIEII